MKSWKVRLAVVIAVCLLMCLATQWAAYRIGHTVDLGSRLHVNGWQIYPPWRILTWGQYKSSALAESRLILTVGVVLVGLAAIRMSVNCLPVRPVGKDKWATLSDMKEAGLLHEPKSTRSIVVGRYKRKLLAYSGPEHQLVTGATRSGKGVGHVIPTLLGGWLESVVVFDVKSELWRETAGFRSRFTHAAFFNPTRPDSIRYNPLLEVRRDENEIRDIQNIVEMLVNPDGQKATLDVWDQHASVTLVALTIHVLYAEEEKSLGRVRDLLLDFDRSFPRIMRTEHLFESESGERRPHPEVVRVAKDMLAQPPKFQSGVRATAVGYLILFADEMVRRNTATSDFCVSDLMCSEHPVSLYLQPPASDGPRLRPLMRIMLNQICRVLMEDLETDGQGRPKKHKLLLELDEFPTLGKLDFLQDALRKLTGYGVKAHIIAQSISDITEAYGQNTSLLDNIHVQVAFGSSDTLTQRRISQMTGTVTEYRRSYSRPRSILSYLTRHGSSGSVSDGEQVRPLMQPGEVRELPSDEQLVFVTGHPPIRCRKIRYFDDKAFKNRCIRSPDQSLKLDLPRGDNELLHPWNDTCPPPAEEEEQEDVTDEQVVTHEPEDEDEDYAETQAELDDDLYGL